MRQEAVPKVPERATPGTEADRRWWWAEASIWTERMVSALVDGVKGGKWYSLMDKVIRLTTLEAAWRKVARNAGSAGVDGVSIERFPAGAGLQGRAAGSRSAAEGGVCLRGGRRPAELLRQHPARPAGCRGGRVDQRWRGAVADWPLPGAGHHERHGALEAADGHPARRGDLAAAGQPLSASAR